jgi:predicted AAA+ superfamily ATPase
MSAIDSSSFEEARESPESWGRLTESAIGAHLLNTSVGTEVKVYYWRDKNREVDFVLSEGESLTAIEVKSRGKRTSLPGLDSFSKLYRPARSLLVGGGGVALEEFLSRPVAEWVG